MESAPNWILTTLASQLCCSDKSLTFYSSLQACFVFVFNKIGWQMNCGIPSYSTLSRRALRDTHSTMPTQQPVHFLKKEKELDLHLINGTNQNAKQWVNMSTTPPNLLIRKVSDICLSLCPGSFQGVNRIVPRNSPQAAEVRLVYHI